MIYRLVKIALLTGAAHLFTLVTLKLLAKTLPPEVIGLIGEVDSLFFLALSAIAFGLQLSAVRDIALSDNWKETYKKTQKARIALGFLLLLIALLSFKKQPYIIFLFAPVFSLSGDYALYGLSQPVKAASLAFLRVFFPSLILILCAFFFPSFIFIAYIISIALIYILTGFITAHWLSCNYWYSFSFNDLKLYKKSIPLGVATVATYFFGLGIIALGSYFYSGTVLGIAYLGIKIYLIYRGILRIINQTFVKEMVDDEVGLKVDKLSLVTGVALITAVIIFPHTFIELFFNSQFLSYKNFIVILAIAGLISSGFISLINRSILKRLDVPYAFISIIAAVISVLSLMIMSLYYDAPHAFGLAILSGEATFLIGLIWIHPDLNYISRITFFFKLVLLASLSYLIKVWFGDNIFSMFTAIGIFILLVFFLYGKTFKFYKQL